MWMITFTFISASESVILLRLPEGEVVTVGHVDREQILTLELPPEFRRR